MLIKIFITGGTIDGHNYTDPALTPKKYKSLIPDLLKQGRVNVSYSVTALMHKDSRVITDADKKYMVKRCNTTPEEKIIITHGTATLIETAKYLQNKIKRKTVIIMGSQIPANDLNSDALFNLGAAFTAVQILEKGVFIVMNGKVFNPGNIRKNKELQMFEEINK